MSAGPFKWKQALLSPKVRVQIDDYSISVSTATAETKTAFKDIEDVYVYRMCMPPLSSMLHADIVAGGGDKVRFGVSGIGMPSGFDEGECRKAIIAFLSHFERFSPEARVYEGSENGPATLVSAQALRESLEAVD